MTRIRIAAGFVGALAIACSPAARSGDAIPLNTHARLGQVFSSGHPFVALTVIVPSWCDSEGGLTISLWDSPARQTLLARQAFRDIADNASVELYAKKPLPPGSYFWEADQRTGTTQVGLYASALDADATDCAYLDGTPDRRKRFLFHITATSFPFAGVPDLLKALGKDAPQAEREDAFRQLAVKGTPDCVAPLADWLGNPEISHLARFALEPMPWPAVDDALRASLPSLQGPLAVGVIHSLGARRDAAAVPLLRTRLANADPAVGCAAADALGKIATGEAAETLLPALDSGSPGQQQLAVADALLTCARRLAEGGDRAKSVVIFDSLRLRDLPPPIRLAALCGALEARGEESFPLLIELLCGGEPASVTAALWAIQQGLPGTNLTKRLGQALPNLPPASQIPLISALGERRDPEAVSALAQVAEQGNAGIRLAVVRALQRIASPKAAPRLAAFIRDEATVSGAAESALGSLPGAEADAETIALMKSDVRAQRFAGIRLAGNRMLEAARPDLLACAGDADQEIRLAALKALKDLAISQDIPALLNLLASAPSDRDRDAVEKVAAVACARSADLPVCAAELARGMEKGDLPSRLAHLRLLAGLGDRFGRQPVLAAASGDDPELRAAAFRLLDQWPAPEAAPDLLRLAATSPDIAGRSLCLRACLRLAGTQGLPVAQALDLCREAAPLIRRDEEKRRLLGTLAGLAHPAALAMAREYAGDPVVREEALAAVQSIEAKLK